MRHNLYFPVPELRNHNRIAEVANAVIDFDLVVQEFLEGGDVEDFVRGGLGGVDYELFFFESGQPNFEKNKKRKRERRTFFVTFPPFPCVPADPVPFAPAFMFFYISNQELAY